MGTCIHPLPEYHQQKQADTRPLSANFYVVQKMSFLWLYIIMTNPFQPCIPKGNNYHWTQRQAPWWSYVILSRIEKSRKPLAWYKIDFPMLMLTSEVYSLSIHYLVSIWTNMLVKFEQNRMVWTTSVSKVAFPSDQSLAHFGQDL